MANDATMITYKRNLEIKKSFKTFPYLVVRSTRFFLYKKPVYKEPTCRVFKN